MDDLAFGAGELACLRQTLAGVYSLPCSIRTSVETPDGAGGATASSTDHAGYHCRLQPTTTNALKAIAQGRIEVTTRWVIGLPYGTLIGTRALRPKDQIVIGTDVYLIQQILTRTNQLETLLQCAKLT